MTHLIDNFGRHINYLRISVTDRCDFRCVYCMPEKMKFLSRADILSLEELERLCRIFISLGIRKIRITGGEPLVRRDVMQLVEALGLDMKKGLLDELTLTTNGSQLHNHAEALFRAGVRRLNVSLDTLDSEKFRTITRGGRLEQVLDNLTLAREAGLKIKINCVALKGINEDDIEKLVAFCGEKGDDLTFIEVMPMGEMGLEHRQEQFWPLADLRARLEKKLTLRPDAHRTGGPARYVHCKETNGRIGFISPLTQNFCAGCNRVRLTCRGFLYLCLGQEDRIDLRDLLRQNPENDDPVRKAILKALTIKPEGHDFIINRQSVKETARHMSVTGG